MKQTKRLALIFATLMLMCVAVFGVNAANCGTGNHTMAKKTVAATCEDPGYDLVYCSVCGEEFSKGSYTAPSHKYNMVYAVLPTCTESGRATYAKCEVCGDTINEEFEVAALGHKMYEEVIDATCTTAYYYMYKCKVCGFIEKECEIGSPKNHTFKEETIDIPSCTVAGELQRTCTQCGLIEFVIVPATGRHKYKTVVPGKAPTCTENGYTAKLQCENCDDVVGGEQLNPLGHLDENKDLYCDRENCKEAIESEPFTEGIYTYTVKAGAATIKAVDNTISGDVVIPSTLGGYPVVAIGDEAFAESFNITSVVIPEGVTYIDEDAFALCFRMESVTLPESLETIENWVFGACLSLKEIVLPENVVSINDSAFDSCLSLEKIVVKNAEASIGEYICYTTLLPKDITTSEWVEKYITAYEAMLNGDENAETLMAELETHTTILEDEAAVLPELTIYSHDPSTAKTYAEENGIHFKNISELEEPHTCNFGEWYTETEPTVFSEGVSKRVCDCGKFETKPIAKLESAVTKDETTNIEITYTEENFESEVEIVVSEEEINANIVFGDEFENFKSFDISLEADGEKVQPNGYVTVKLPIPEGFNADSTVVYYVDDSGNKTKLESTTENGYIVFETDHFSEYVLVDESSRIEPPHEHSYTASITKEATCTENGTTTYTCSCGDSYNETIEATGHDFEGSKCKNCDYDKADTCGCNCHKGGFMGFIWKIINFFNKLFKSKQYCACGEKHY